MNITKQKQIHRYREQTNGYQWEDGSGEGQGKIDMREIKRYKISVAKQMSHRGEIYSVGNIVNNYIISLCSDIA